MFCTKCGQQIPDDSKFCEFCGEKFDESAGTQDSFGAGDATATEKASPVDTIKNSVNDIVNGKKNDKQLIVIGAVAVVALLAILLIFNGLFGSSPKKALKNYIEGAATYDFKDYWNNSLNAKKAQKKLDVYDADDYEDAYEDAKDLFEEAKEEMEDDDKEIKVKVDIKDVEKIGKSDKEFDWACELMEDRNDDYDVDKIQKFAIVKARVKLEYYEDGDKEDSDTSTTEYLLVKLGGDWFVTGFSNDDIKDYLKDKYK